MNDDVIFSLNVCILVKCREAVLRFLVHEHSSQHKSGQAGMTGSLLLCV